MSIDTVAIECECRRQFEEDRRRVQRLEQHQREIEAQMKLAMDLYIAQITAPWQALADQIRSEMKP